MKSFFFLSLFAIGNISAINLLHTARKFSAPNESIPIEISVTELNKITQATLFARTTGTQLFMPVPLFGGGRTYNGAIPNHIVRQPGVEYYISAQTIEGMVITFPATNAVSNPISVRISSDNPKPQIRILSPTADSVTQSKRPIISVSFSSATSSIDISTVKIKLDGQDITSSSKITSTHAHYKPPVHLTSGKHSVEISVKDLLGNSAEDVQWDFIIGGLGVQELSDEEEWKTNGSLSSQYQYSRVDSAQGKSNIAYPNGFATGNLDFRATRKDEEFFVGPLYFTTQETENQQPAQNLSFGYKNQYFETKWGNVSANITQLTGGGSMMGGEIVYFTQAQEKKKGFRVQVNGGRTRMAVEANENNFGVGVYAQRLLGGKIDHYYSEQFSWFIGAKDLRDIQESLKNPGNAVPLANQATSIGFNYSKENVVFDTLKGEIGYAYSELFEESSTVPEQYRDSAWNLGLAKKVKTLNTDFSFDYSEFRPEYIGAGSDTRSVNLSGNSELYDSKISLASKYGFTHDNLEGQKQATTNSHTVGLSPSLKLENWPVLSLSENFSLQDTIGNLNLQSQAINNSITLSASQNFDYLDRSHSANISLSQNNSVSSRPGSTSSTVARSVSTSYSLPDLLTWFGFDISYSFNTTQNSSSPAINFSDSSGINLNFQIKSIQFSIPFAFSMNRSWDDVKPKMTDNLTLTFSQSLSYTFYEKHSLSLSLGHTRYLDFINPLSNYEQLSLTFSYNTQF